MKFHVPESEFVTTVSDVSEKHHYVLDHYVLDQLVVIMAKCG